MSCMFFTSLAERGLLHYCLHTESPAWISLNCSFLPKLHSRRLSSKRGILGTLLAKE